MEQNVVFPPQQTPSTAGSNPPAPSSLPPVPPLQPPIAPGPQSQSTIMSNGGLPAVSSPPFPSFQSSTMTGMPSQPNPISTSGIPPVSSPPIPPATPPTSMPGISGFPLWAKIAIGAVGVFILLLILLTSLSKGKQSSGGNVTLEYWELWEDKNTLNQLFADFHKQYPNITVDVVAADPKDYGDRLQARIKAGTGPDLFTYHNSWVPELRSSLSPLSTTAMTTDEFNKTFYPVAQKDLVHNGAIYGIPLEIDTLALFVNTSILQAAGAKPPTTWDQFNNIAPATTVKDANGKIQTAGAAIGAYDNIAHASDILAMLFAQNGADQTDLTSTMSNATDALKFYSSFETNPDTSVWDTSLPNSLVEFAQGNVAMLFGYSYDVFTIRIMNPTLSFSIYPVPHLPNRSITTASYWVQGVSSRSKHQKEAMLLMHFLAQKDTEEKMYSLQAKTRPFGEPYARMDLGDTLKNDPLVYPFISQAKTAQSTYFSSNTNDNGINAQMNGYLGNAIRSMLTGSSPDSAINTLASGVNQILGQYGL